MEETEAEKERKEQQKGRKAGGSTVTEASREGGSLIMERAEVPSAILGHMGDVPGSMEESKQPKAKLRMWINY